MSSDPLQNDHFVKIALLIQNNYKNFDGFVIIKSAPFIEVTMCDLAFSLEKNSKSIIFISFNHDPAHLISEIENELLQAIDISCSFNIHEVSYLKNGDLFRSVRLRRDIKGVLFSPNYAPLGSSSDLIFKPSYKQIRQNKTPSDDFEFFGDFNRNILHFMIYPNLSPELFDILVQTDAKIVVIESYGIGNIPKTYKPFTDFVNNLIKRGVLIFSFSQCDKGHVQQSYGTSFESIGIRSCYDMTPSAVLAKLAYLSGKYKNNNQQILELMKQNFRGELTIDPHPNEKLPEFEEILAKIMKKENSK